MRPRIFEVLMRANGAKLSAEQIARSLNIATGEHGNPSEPMRELLRELAKAVEYKKISMSWPTAERAECAYWIEPPREATQ